MKKNEEPLMELGIRGKFEKFYNQSKVKIANWLCNWCAKVCELLVFPYFISFTERS